MGGSGDNNAFGVWAIEGRSAGCDREGAGDMVCAVGVSSNVGDSLVSIRMGCAGVWWSKLESLTGG